MQESELPPEGRCTPLWSAPEPRLALGLPIGCRKDDRSGLWNHFPITHQLEPETMFLFPGGLAQDRARSKSALGVISGPSSKEHRKTD